jgi:hypothetical protein
MPRAAPEGLLGGERGLRIPRRLEVRERVVELELVEKDVAGA